SSGVRSRGGDGHDRERVNPNPIQHLRKEHHVKSRAMKQVASIGALCLLGAVLLTTASAATSLKTGLKAFVIPKNLGNPYFTTTDSVKSGGALKALQELKEKGTETSG